MAFFGLITTPLPFSFLFSNRVLFTGYKAHTGVGIKLNSEGLLIVGARTDIGLLHCNNRLDVLLLLI